MFTPVNKVLGGRYNTVAALAFFRQAVEAERASLDLVVRVASFLKRAQHDPGLRFQKA